MNGAARGDAVYTVVAASNPNFSKLSSGEQATLKSYFETVYGADTTYIQANAEADPGSTLLVEASTVVAPTGGGPCSGTGTITGKGTIS